MNSDRQMPNAVHLYAVGSTSQDEFRNRLAFQIVDQEDQRDVFFQLPQELQHLRFVPAETRVLG
jgi:hypothetical protein